MIDHITISVADFDAAKVFYEKALAPLGHTLLMTVPVEHTDGVKVGGFGSTQPQFWLQETGRQSPPVHVAFAVQDRTTVDAFHAAALSAGGTDNGAPGLRPHYHEAYYGAFVLDPDGNNMEAVCHQL